MANHGQEAIDKVLASQDDTKESIHIVLMDVEMPILDVCHLSLNSLIDPGSAGHATPSRS